MPKAKFKPVYHGWIYIDRTPGLKDHFSCYCVDSDGKKIHGPNGYGVEGADATVRFFEVTRGLGRISLESTPLGLRVFTLVTE